MNGINLHALVNPAISVIHPNQPGTLYQSTGQLVDEDGVPRATYAPGVPVALQVQSESATTLYYADKTGDEEVIRRMYVVSKKAPAEKIAGVVRPLSRNGDMIQFTDEGTWWEVNGPIEDFTRSGWVNVRATMQVDAPDFAYSGW